MKISLISIEMHCSDVKLAAKVMQDFFEPVPAMLSANYSCSMTQIRRRSKFRSRSNAS